MNLKEKIEKSGLKQKFVAEKLGITPEHFNQMVNGRVTMPEKVRNEVNELLSKVLI